MKIISRNYLDKASDLKWLIRDENEPREKAVACKAISATRVEFRPSNEFESGFGCSKVGWAKTAESTEAQQELTGTTPLRFNGYDFKAPGGMTVSRVARLELTPDGQVMAAI